MTAAQVSQVIATVLRSNTTVKVHASQVIVGILRQNTAVSAQDSQIIATVLRKEVTPPNIQTSQVTAETLRPSIITAQVSQVVSEILSSERTLKATLPISLTLQAHLVPGLYLVNRPEFAGDSIS